MFFNMMEPSTVVSRDILHLLSQTGTIARIVLLILLTFSVISWAIIFYKLRTLSKAKKQSMDFLSYFRKSKKFSDINFSSDRYRFSPLTSIFRAGFNEINFQLSHQGETKNSLNLESLQRALLRISNKEIEKLENFMGFLATTGSVTPFIGLFGTVWGIMDSFREIGMRGSASLATVAPGIAEALISTAAGLFTAIPAVIFYNHFLRQIKSLVTEMENFILEFTNLTEKLLL
ncbi:MAG: protein TolQ [Candidatus Aminicenantia bacterium]